jgi:quercetin dioxygenase-like cupin family protein
MNNKYESPENSKISYEIEKGKEHFIVEIVEYLPNAVMSKTIIKKATGNVTAMSFSEGEELGEKTFPYDNNIQIIDDAVDVTIAHKEYHLKLGSGILIPAHSLHHFNANQKLKMLSTIIKSGYED